MDAFNEARELTVTEATKRGVAGLIADVETGGPVAVTRHGRRVAAVVPMSCLTADSGRRTSFDDVLVEFGHTRESLAAVKDDDSLDD